MITLEKRTEEFVIENVSRRNFLQGMLSASAFVLCVTKSPLLAKAASGVSFGTEELSFWRANMALVIRY